jgi:HEAT repeats
MKTSGLAALAALAAVWAQAPAIQNAKPEIRSAAGGLENTMRQILASAQTEPVWVGYTVPAVAGRRETCWTGTYAATVHLEGPKQFYILYRIAEGRIERIRTFSPDCVIDGSDTKFMWLTDVRPAESVAYLAGLAQGTRYDRDDALTALAVHAATEAVQSLLDFVRNGRTAHIRGRALVWLGQTAPFAVSEPVIRDAIDNARETEVKRQAVAALAQVPRGEGVPLLLQLARSNRNATVQKAAMSWLGRSRDERAVRFFEEVLGR